MGKPGFPNPLPEGGLGVEAQRRASTPSQETTRQRGGFGRA